MASVASPRSPAMSQALTSPLEFLPVTRFPTDDRLDSIHEAVVETQKERNVIQSQPYRTTQLVFPNPKSKPDFFNNKLSGRKPTVYRPLDKRSVVANLNENQALVSRQQYNNPRPLYSDQNVQEAIYVQTGVNYNQPQASPQLQQQFQQQQAQLQQQQAQFQQQQAQFQQQQAQAQALAQQRQQQQRQQQQQLQQRQQQQQIPRPLQQQQQRQAQLSPRIGTHLDAPVHRTPDQLPDFNPQKSPTYRAILEEEGPGTLHSAPSIKSAPPQRIAHNTAPTYNLNSVGMPNDRIAQSGSFKRLMWNVMGDA